MLALVLSLWPAHRATSSRAKLMGPILLAYHPGDTCLSKQEEDCSFKGSLILHFAIVNTAEGNEHSWESLVSANSCK